MTMQVGIRSKRDRTTVTNRFYNYKIDLEFIVVLICVVNIIGFIVIFIGVRSLVIVNLIYPFIFCVLIDALHLP